MLRFVAVALLLMLSAPTWAQCTCIDIGDIKRRIKESEVAISAYTAEMQKMVEQIQRTHDPLPYTPERRQKLQTRVQGALDQAATGAIPTAKPLGERLGGTNNLCMTSIEMHPSATACMRESVKRHEDFHQKECMKTLSAGGVLDSITSGKDRFERSNATLIKYATEEVSAYTTEMTFLQGELARLQQAPECKPKPPPVELRDYTAQPRQRKPSG